MVNLGGSKGGKSVRDWRSNEEGPDWLWICGGAAEGRGTGVEDEVTLGSGGLAGSGERGRSLGFGAGPAGGRS